MNIGTIPHTKKKKKTLDNLLSLDNYFTEVQTTKIQWQEKQRNTEIKLEPLLLI